MRLISSIQAAIGFPIEKVETIDEKREIVEKMQGIVIG